MRGLLPLAELLDGGWTTAKRSLASGMTDGSAMRPIAASVTVSHPTPATAPPPAVTAVSAAPPAQHAPLPATAPTPAATIAAGLSIVPPLAGGTTEIVVSLLTPAARPPLPRANVSPVTSA